MVEGMDRALAEYGRTIKREGWKAGEHLIDKNSHRFKDFKKWAGALAIVLRAKELLEKEN